MRKILKKPLVYLLISMMLLPTWLVTGMINAPHAKASATDNPSIISYVIDNEVISPNSDGIKDSASIDLKFSESVAVDVDILDTSDNKVKDFYNSASVIDPNSRLWNGKNESNEVVADGTYKLNVSYKDSYGHNVIDTSKSIVVDKVAPVLDSVQISSNNSNPNWAKAGNTINVSFIASEALDLNNANTVAMINSTPATVENIAGLNYRASRLTSAADAEGLVSFIIDFKDEAGNSGARVITTTNNSSVTFDKTAPTASLPYSNYTYSNQPLTFTVTSNDPSAVLEYSIDNTNWVPYTTPVVKSNLGNYWFYGRATDLVGNVSEEAWVNYIIDTTAPTVTAGFDITTTSAYTTVATASDELNGSGIATYQWSATGPGNVTFGTPLALNTTVQADVNGVYVIKLTVTDKAGNSNFGTFNLTWNASSNIDSSDDSVQIPAGTTGNGTIEVAPLVNGGTLDLSKLPSTSTPATETTPGSKTITLTGEITVHSPSSNLNVVFPAGLTITGPENWDGTVNLPNIETALPSGVTLPADAGNYSTADSIVAIGLSNGSLTFSAPVKLIFPGKADKMAGYIENNQFKSVTVICPATPITSGECRTIENGTDLVIWTSHFTQFVTYEQTAVAAPVLKVAAVVVDGVNYAKIEWQGNGSSRYVISISGVPAETVQVSLDDTNLYYVRYIKILSFGKYDVSMTAAKSGAESINNAVYPIEFVAPVTPKVSEQKTEPAKTVTVAPQRAKAAEPAPQKEEIKPAPANDDNGKIKGDEDNNKAESEKINWTPWIVLFVLIILAGAATGGYFYWFNDDGIEERTVVREPKKEEKSKKQGGKSKPNKKSKRW